MLHANSSAIAENIWWDFNSSTGKANRIFYIEKDFRALKAHRMCESVVCNGVTGAAYAAGTYQLYLTVIYPTQVELPAVSSTICHRDTHQNGHS